MRPWIRYTLNGVLLAAFAAGIVLLLVQTRREAALLTCSSLEVHLEDELRFVNEDDVRQAIDERYGTYLGERLDSLNLGKIEEIMNMQSAVLKSEAWVTSDGKLHVSILQREPVLRFMDGDKGFYVDRTGFVFPLFRRYTAPTPVVEGPLPSDSEWIMGTISMMQRLGQTAAMSSTITSDRKGDISIVFEDEKETYLIGRPSDLSSKFERIEIYRKRIAPGHDYRSVNLKYKGQIVCR